MERESPLYEEKIRLDTNVATEVETPNDSPFQTKETETDILPNEVN